MKTRDVLKKSLMETTDNVFIQLFRYTFVGGASFAVDFLLMVGLTELCGLYYLASATLSFLAGLLVNYAMSKAWVFSRSRIRQKGIEFLLFAAIGVVGLALNYLLLKFITEWTGLHYTLSKIITAAIVYLYNFLARKYLLFHITR